MLAVAALLLAHCAPSRTPRGKPESRAPAPPTSSSGANARSGALVLSREQGLLLLCQVLLDLDTDCDRRVTVDDERARPQAPNGSGSISERFPYVARAAGVEIGVDQQHQAAQLVQELVVGLRSSDGSFPLALDRVRPTRRLTRSPHSAIIIGTHSRAHRRRSSSASCAPPTDEKLEESGEWP